MKHTAFISRLMMAIVVIPLQSLNGWKIEKFNKIEQNEVTASAEGLNIKVNSSAGPLVYSFSPKLRVLGFKVEGEFRGLPKFKKPSDQGTKGNDDYPLRIGFVVPGSKKLSGLRKLLAPSWVSQLYSFLPPNSGLDRVQFYNVTQSTSQLGDSRKHPASDLINEEFFALAEKAGPYSFSYKLKTPLEAVAIWLSIDGDDTKSNFEVFIKNLNVEFDTEGL